MQKDIGLFCWQVRELKKYLQQERGIQFRGVKRGGGSACSRVLVCELAWNGTLGMYQYFLLFLLSDVHPTKRAGILDSWYTQLSASYKSEVVMGNILGM